MNSICYAEAIDYLLVRVPEISGVYRQEQLGWSSEVVPPHIVYGSVFSDFLRRIIIEGTSDTEQSQSDIISRAFQVIEELAQSADFETRCIVEASILESLLGEGKEDWQRFSPYFGEHTLNIALKLAEKMGLSINSSKTN